MRMLTMAFVLLVSIVAYSQVTTDSTRYQSLERVRLFGIGHTDILDTYLSQEKSTGTELHYLSQTFSRHADSKITREMTHHLFASSTGTRGNNNSLLTAIYGFRLGCYYNLDFSSPSINLMIGGLMDGTLGGAYNTRNSNNPAQARIALTIDPAARLCWGFRIARFPMKLNYAVSLPLIGAAFSPNYGQSYYEIFSKGNYDHNIVLVFPFSGPQLHQMLTFDFSLFKTTFSFGYLGDIRQLKANSLKYHHYSNAVVFGWKF